MWCLTMPPAIFRMAWVIPWIRLKGHLGQPMVFMLAYGLFRWTARGRVFLALVSVAFAFGASMHKAVFGAITRAEMPTRWWLTTKNCLNVASLVVIVTPYHALRWTTEGITGKSLMEFSPFLLSQAWQRGFPKEQPSLATFLLAHTSTWAQVRNTIIKERKLLALGIIWVTKTSCQPIVGW